MQPNRLHCPVRHESGNCTCAGGFCTAVPDPVCEAVRNAYDSGWTDCALKVRKEQRLKASPTIEAEPVRHGRWIKTENGMRENLNTRTVIPVCVHDCSICGWHTGNQGQHFNYCPNCGAKMDLVEERHEPDEH